MTIRRVLTTTLLAGVGLVGVLSLTQGIDPAYAQGKDNRGNDGRPGGPGGRLAHLCQEGRLDEHFDRMTTFLDAELDLTAAQQDNWAAVLDAVDDNDLEAACATGDREEARAALEEMREPMETFFSSLSEDQKEELRDQRQERRERFRNQQQPSDS